MSIEDPLHNKYSLVRGAARRARQLQSGALPKIVTTSMKACRVAQDEINEGQVSFTVGRKQDTFVAPAAVEPEL